MMTQVRQTVAEWARNEEGASLVEYVLLVALIAIVSIGAVTLMGGKISATFQNIADKLK